MSHDREKTIFHLSHESIGHECSHYILPRLFIVRVNERIFFFFVFILCIYSVYFSNGGIFRIYRMSLHVIFSSKIIFGISFLNFSLLTVSFLLEFLVARAFN